MAHRAHPDETACTGIWPITGNPCKDLPRDGMDTCEAHDPAGDQRRKPFADEIRCTGTNKHSGERCRLPRNKGAAVCGHHGAGARQVRKKAEARVAEQQLRRAADRFLADYDSAPVEDPLLALQSLAGEITAVKDWLRGKVEQLTELRYGGRAGEQVRAEITLYQSALRDTTTVLTAIARLNIDERLAKISERQADAVIEAIEAALSAVGVRDPGQRTIAKQAAAAKLRIVS